MLRRRFLLLIIGLIILNPSNTFLKAQKILKPINRVFWGNSLINYPTQDYLFLGAGGAILISNVVSKDSMKILNSIYLPSVVQDIYVRSNILFALDLLNGLYIYDITDIANPIQLAELDFDKRCYDFLLDSSNIYVTHDTNGISKVNITNLSSPFVENKTSTPSKSLSKYQNYLYCQKGDYYFEDSVRVLNSETLIQVGGFQVGLSYPFYQVKNLRFNANKGFLIENYSGIIETMSSWSDLTILDMSDPINPVRKGQITFNEGVLEFTNSYDTLFIGIYNELFTVDAADINNPTIISATPNIFRDNLSLVYLSVCSPYLFASYDYFAGLQIINMQDIINPEAGLFFDTSSKIGSLEATNSVLIAGRQEGSGLYFVDISDITKPVVKQRYDQNTGYIRGLKIKDYKVFAATEYGLKIFQIDNLDSLNLIGELDYGKTSWRIDVSDSIVAIGGYYYNVHLINVSNSSLPIYIREINMPTGMVVEDIFLQDSLLFISGDYGFTMIYNISDPFNPEQLWSGIGTDWNGVAMFPSDTLLFLEQSLQIRILNIKNPNSPFYVTDIQIPYKIEDIFEKDNFLFVSCYESIGLGYNGFLYIFDISDLENINQIAIAYTAGWANNIFVNEEFIFLSDFEDGVLVFDIDDIMTNMKDELNKNLINNFSLYQNYPNPFNPTSTIKYKLPEDLKVQIKVFDVLGKEVSALVNEEKPAGSHEVKFNGGNLASGIYFYRIQAGSFINTKKMILLK